MAPIDDLKHPEWPPEGVKIPSQVAEEAKAVAEVLSEPEELNVKIILQDLGIVDRKSPEALYLTEVVAWLNTKMEKMNSEAQWAVKSFPSYFKNTNQMEMQRDGWKRQLTIVSQGQEVIKFEVCKRESSSDGEKEQLGIYMKNLLIAEQGIDTTDDIDLQEFMNFATQDGILNDNTNEWWLFSFSDMYGGSGNEKWYLQTYAHYTKEIVSTRKTKNIHLAPWRQMKLQNAAVSGSNVTINTIFGHPKPWIIEITNPNLWSTLAYLQPNGNYLDEKKRRPLIYTGSLIKNNTSFEDLQTVVDRVLFPNGVSIIYSENNLFPDFTWRSPAFQDAVKRYFAMFPWWDIEIETNASGMRTYVDMTKKSYVLRYELNNQFLNRPYNKDLVMDLTWVLVPKNWIYSLDEWKFKQQLATQVEQIITKNFYFIDKQKYWTNISKQSYKSVKDFSTINALRKNYAGLCSRAAKDTAWANFGLQIPQWHARDAINIEPTDHHYVAVEKFSWKTSLANMGTDTMYEMLSKHLHAWCTVVDIWYRSTTRLWRIHGHRNLAYYCYDTHERYVIDPVTNYGWRGLSRKWIPLEELKTGIFFPQKMRYYKPDIGVYEKYA